MTEGEIFFEALEMATPEARAAYLQGACSGDVTLRRKVDELLKEHFSNDSLLSGPALEGERPGMAEVPVKEAPAQMIGRYKLLEKLVLPSSIGEQREVHLDSENSVRFATKLRTKKEPERDFGEKSGRVAARFGRSGNALAFRRWEGRREWFAR